MPQQRGNWSARSPWTRALARLTKAMALAHGPQQVRVNYVCPGATTRAMLRNEARQLGMSELARFVAGAGGPLQRGGPRCEIAQAALLLASERFSFVTGDALIVDGGELVGSA